MMITIEPNTTLQRSTDINAREFDGETVMMDQSLENYYGLDEVGTRIWQLLESDQTLSSLCETLSQEYDVNSTKCMEEIIPFIQELLKNKLITIP